MIVLFTSGVKIHWMINFLMVIIITIRNFCGDNKIIKYLIKGGNIVFIKLRHNYI